MKKEILDLMWNLSQGNINYDYASKKALILLDISISLPRNKRTKKTNETEDFVDSYIKENSYPPTYMEIVDKFKLKSTSAAYARCRHFRHKMKSNKC